MGSKRFVGQISTGDGAARGFPPGLRPECFHFARGSAERRDSPSRWTPAPLPSPPGPRPGRTRRGGSSARVPGGAGGGSGRGESCGTGRGCRCSGAPLARLPGAATAQRSPPLLDPGRAPRGRVPAGWRLFRAAPGSGSPHLLPAAPAPPIPARGVSAGGCRLPPPSRAGPLTSRWCCGRPISGAAGPRRTAPGPAQPGRWQPSLTGPGSGTGSLHAAWPGRRGNRGRPRRRWSAQAGDRRALPVEKPPGVKGRTLILLDVNTKSPVRIISENFLSLQLDPSIIHDGWLDFLSSRRLVTLARGLAPAFLRFAGKRTDFLQFHNVKNPAKSRGGPGPDYYLKNYEDDIVRSDIALDKQKGCKIAQHPDIMLELQREKAAQMHLVLLKEQFSNTYSNLTLTARSLDKLYNFADCSGLHLIFALNAVRRNPNNSWNSSNALSLLKYSASKKYNISWELGNEPNNYRTLIGRSVNGSQLGKDYIQLRSLLQLIRTYSRANLYGPNIGRPRKNVIALLEGFMKVAGSTVDAVTWQHYYIDGRVAKVTDFLKTRLLDTLSDQIRKIQKVVNTYTPGKKIWLEGVGATSAGGMNNLSDSYAAGFLWLNTLGLLASQGIDVVVRHSFLDHGHNHLVDQNFNPLPDYWLSLLYKRLIGPKVLAIHVAGLQRKPRPGRVIRDKLRIYAHCTSYHNHNYVRGSITLYIINLHRSRKKIKLAGTLRDKIVHQYLLQPYGKDGLHSKSVQLNGQPLAMVDDGTLPELKPRPLRAGRTLVIPPLTMSFYVVKNVNALACRYR
ncbi:inactive heparanase-2 isoform X2 [Phalacrocorax aristotelis]|uniref:inactive heparanase-2 isoform X2 n=1 Tax=Phalacrocorax aristotelis TaxID=126867 RepID=UPI003F4C93F1